ncbi:DUF423 domain-containing protein [Micavibrio aeruginosavorus]|uniref:DUF423 domain-containing protein n=1 Tax=Micavibrio aeruginosavorus TaxID=349221 RepID=UPI003F4AB46A
MKYILCATGLIGFLSVVLGAAGDHLLTESWSASMVERFDVALRYHQNYSIVLLVLSLYGLTRTIPSRILMVAACLFLLGIVIFCGSLYASLHWPMAGLTLGTPVGGISLMAGWLALILYGLRSA